MIKKISYASAFVILAFFSCQGQNPSIEGKYESKKYSKIEWLSLKLKNRTYSKGSSLQINIDSSFIYETCAQISKGNWWVKKDSLFLLCHQVQFKIDSFNYIPKYKKGTQCSSKPNVYHITNEGLLMIFKLKNGGKAEEYLVKQNS